jgi:hypothetical protein
VEWQLRQAVGKARREDAIVLAFPVEMALATGTEAPSSAIVGHRRQSEADKSLRGWVLLERPHSPGAALATSESSPKILL